MAPPPAVGGRAASHHVRETTMTPAMGRSLAAKAGDPQSSSPVVGIWLVVSPKWATISAATAWEPVDARAMGSPRFRPPTPGYTDNWRPGWRSSSGDRGEQPPAQQQAPPGQRRWSQGSSDPLPSGTANTSPSRSRGCHVCGHPGCHSDFHREDAVSPQAPPATGCLVCGQRDLPWVL